MAAHQEKMLKNLQFSIALLLAFLIVHALHAAPLKTLSLDFKRELTENDKTERTAGTLHYDAEAARVIVEVTEPLKQIMIVKGKVVEIYYPVENQAFRFTFEGRIPLPFVESILQSTQAEYGLTTIGYSLDRHEIVDDVLYTYWTPPEKAKDKLGTVILGSRDDRLISAEVKTPAVSSLQNPFIGTTPNLAIAIFLWRLPLACIVANPKFWSMSASSTAIHNSTRNRQTRFFSLRFRNL